MMSEEKASGGTHDEKLKLEVEHEAKGSGLPIKDEGT